MGDGTGSSTWTNEFLTVHLDTGLPKLVIIGPVCRERGDGWPAEEIG